MLILSVETLSKCTGKGDSALFWGNQFEISRTHGQGICHPPVLEMWGKGAQPRDRKGDHSSWQSKLEIGLTRLIKLHSNLGALNHFWKSLLMSELCWKLKEAVHLNYVLKVRPSKYSTLTVKSCLPFFFFSLNQCRHFKAMSYIVERGECWPVT